MKVSTRGEYGVRAMVALAKNYGEGPLSIAAVARESSVPYAYLEQLIVPLRRAGLVIHLPRRIQCNHYLRDA